MIRPRVSLSDSDREELLSLLNTTDLRNKVSKRVIVLLELDKGRTIGDVKSVVGLSYPTVSGLIAKYKDGGLGCLYDKKQSGRPARIDGTQRAKITALACSESPEGFARWSLRLLADRIVELNFCDAISHSCVADILKKTTSSRI